LFEEQLNDAELDEELDVETNWSSVEVSRDYRS
jgi:hypothetical protein